MRTTSLQSKTSALSCLPNNIDDTSQNDHNFLWDVPVSIAQRVLTSSKALPVAEDTRYLWDLPVSFSHIVQTYQQVYQSPTDNVTTAPHFLQSVHSLDSEHLTRQNCMYSSPTEVSMPSWPPTAEEQRKGLHNTYLAHIEEMRSSQCSSTRGMRLVGTARSALAQKFLEVVDRKYPCWLINTGEGDEVNIFLCGDPSTPHAAITIRLWTKLSLEIPRERAKDFLKLVQHAADPRRNLNIKEAGSVRQREFAVGMSSKEPDFFIWKRGEPKSHRSVIEVAFKNEDANELLWEIATWSQQTLRTASTARIIDACNAVGIDVEIRQQCRDDQCRPAAFAVVLADAADSRQPAINIYLLNASETYYQQWQNIVHDATSSTINLIRPPENAINIRTRWLCRMLPDEWHDVAEHIHLSLAELTDIFIEADDLDYQDLAAEAALEM
ncbi:unnamed protein product [Sympodiomycopsis kandeliae]